MIGRRLICWLAFTLPAANAFAAIQPSSSRAVSWRANERAVARPLPNLLNHQSSTTAIFMSTASSDQDMLNQITTAIGKTASTLVSASFFILLAYRRDALILTLWIGVILNAVLSKVAKKILDHERPEGLQSNDNVKLKPSDGGMPSSHAMSLGFVGTVITGGVIPVEHRVVAGVAMAVYSAFALRYRIRGQLHTTEQVVVGLGLGIGNALAWIKFGVGCNDNAGPVLSWVRNNVVSAETDLFPYAALIVPIVVGTLVVGSFERRIALWMKNRGKED